MRKLSIGITSLATVALLAGSVAVATNDNSYQGNDHNQKLTIVKTVEDTTTGQGPVDANDEANALEVHSGDTLVYHITVTGKHDDLKYLKISDEEVAGLQRQGTLVISADGKSATLTATVVGLEGYVTNSACLVHKSRDIKGPQVLSEGKPKSLCDLAVVKVVAKPVVTPSPSVSPSPTPTVVVQQTVVTLPSVGAHGGNRP